MLEVKDWRLDRQVELLTYVAITRATHEAFITYSNRSELVSRLVV